jgi:hypothetical protein
MRARRVPGHGLAVILYICNRKWIPLQSYSGSVHYFLLSYPFIYYVAQKELPYFMHRLPQDVACL